MGLLQRVIVDNTLLTAATLTEASRPPLGIARGCVNYHSSMCTYATDAQKRVIVSTLEYAQRPFGCFSSQPLLTACAGDIGSRYSQTYYPQHLILIGS